MNGNIELYAGLFPNFRYVDIVNKQRFERAQPAMALKSRSMSRFPYVFERSYSECQVTTVFGFETAATVGPT